jgi:hypothetical protein
MECWVSLPRRTSRRVVRISVVCGRCRKELHLYNQLRATCEQTQDDAMRLVRGCPGENGPSFSRICAASTQLGTRNDSSFQGGIPYVFAAQHGTRAYMLLCKHACTIAWLQDVTSPAWLRCRPRRRPVPTTPGPSLPTASLRPVTTSPIKSTFNSHTATSDPMTTFSQP